MESTMAQAYLERSPARIPHAPSLYAVFVSALVGLVVGFATFGATVHQTNGFLVWSDGLVYFLYARSAVLDLDTDVTNEYDELERRFPGKSNKFMDPLRSWSKRDVVSGRIQPPWPVGAGLVMTPFYAAGYVCEIAVARAAGRAPDSYGLIPQYFFCLGSVAYSLLGLWAVFLCCRQLSTDRIAWISALGIVLAGPVMFYTFFNPSMAHASSFGLVALLTLLWWRQWQHGSGPLRLASLGLLVGLLATIRYQNALFGLLLAGLVLHEARRVALPTVIRTAVAGLLGCLIPLIVLIPQFQSASASAAATQGNVVTAMRYPIDLTSPYFFHVLLSCRHGAFYWAPVLALGFVGLVSAGRRHSWACVLLAAFLAQVYLIGGLGLVNSTGNGVHDWNNHWGGAPSFGMRYLTECAPLLAIGLTVALTAISRKFGTASITMGIALLTCWNALLVLAYGLETISRSYCLSYHDMAIGVGRALVQLIAKTQ
jgi:hypothetical protein